eukprot:scaffold44888_cov153-Amphora_coffeaeformis.AAC.1
MRAYYAPLDNVNVRTGDTWIVQKSDDGPANLGCCRVPPRHDNMLATKSSSCSQITRAGMGIGMNVRVWWCQSTIFVGIAPHYHHKIIYASKKLFRHVIVTIGIFKSQDKLVVSLNPGVAGIIVARLNSSYRGGNIVTASKDGHIDVFGQFCDIIFASRRCITI